MSVDTSNATADGRCRPVARADTGAIKQAANRPAPASNTCWRPRRWNRISIRPRAPRPRRRTGLYQFIDQTWLGTVKEAGGQLGYGQYADAITKTSSGGYVGQRSRRRGSAIMKLRDDPAAASAMAGALTQSNSFQLTGMIGRRPTDSELYMAHFMGVGGAAKLITPPRTIRRRPRARLFPNAAAANRSIFYDRSGQARSVSEVYSVLNARYAGAANSPATQTAMAMFGGERRRAPAVAVASAARRRLRSPTRPISRRSPTSTRRRRSRCIRQRRHRRQVAPSGRSGVPFAVPGRRRTRAAGLADGAGELWGDRPRSP